MSYLNQLGRVNPLTLRDTALDYILGKETPHTRPMWDYYGNPRELFLPPDHPEMLTKIYGGTEQARRFFYRLLLAMETLLSTFQHFYKEQGWDNFEEIRKQILQETRCMLYFKVIAWLSVDGSSKVEQAIPQMKNLNLHYGLVSHYPEPILHTASCFIGFESTLYEQALSAEKLIQIEKQAELLVNEQVMAADEWDFDFEELERELSEQAVSTESIEIPLTVEQVVEAQTKHQLVQTTTSLLSISCPLQQMHFKRKILDFLEYLQNFVKSWDE